MDKPKNHTFLKQGNAKLPKTVAIFNLLAVEDCPNCETCKDTCYALWRQGAANVLKYRQINSWFAHNNKAQLFRDINTELVKLRTKGVKYVRIHEAGDFFDQSYLLLWVAIATQNPDIQFFAMTKSEFLLPAIDAIGGVKNLNIMLSMIGGVHRNYGSPEWCDQLVKHHGAHKCPDKHDGVCMQQCKYCLKGKAPCFEIHGNLKGRDTYEKTV